MPTARPSVVASQLVFTGQGSGKRLLRVGKAPAGYHPRMPLTSGETFAGFRIVRLLVLAQWVRSTSPNIRDCRVIVNGQVHLAVYRGRDQREQLPIRRCPNQASTSAFGRHRQLIVQLTENTASLIRPHHMIHTRIVLAQTAIQRYCV